MFSIERWMKELVNTFKMHERRIATVERKEETHDAFYIRGQDVSTTVPYSDQVLSFINSVWTPTYVYNIPNITNSFAGGRLTLTTNVPVTSADVTAAATLYYTPYKGNQISLLVSGSGWVMRFFTQLSISLAGLAANKNFDVFIYDVAGTATIALTEWTNDSTRASAISLYEGIYVKTLDPFQRYVGTIRTLAVGQTEDSVTRRFVWNAYNKEMRSFSLSEVTSHTYNGVTRPWNNDTAVRTGWVNGLIQGIRLDVTLLLYCTVAGATTFGGLGVDTTTVINNDIGAVYNYNANFLGAGSGGSVILAPGYHYAQGLERGTDAGSTFSQIYLKGFINA